MEYGYVPIKFYLPENKVGQLWLVGHVLQTMFYSKIKTCKTKFFEIELEHLKKKKICPFFQPLYH